ncbi:hypothetical protein D9M71_767070 [compost metagenome]
MLRAPGQPLTQGLEVVGKAFPRGQFEQGQALVLGIQAHLGAVGQHHQQRQAIALAQGFGIRGHTLEVAVHQQACMFKLHAFFPPQGQHIKVASALHDILVGVPDQLVAMTDKGT